MSPHSYRINPQWSLLGLTHRLADGAAIGLGLGLACVASQAEATDGLLAAATAIIVFYLFAEFTGLYRGWQGVPTEREVLCSLVTWLYTLPLCLAAAFLADRSGALPREVVVAWSLLAPALVGISRIGLRWLQYVLRARGFNTRGFAIVGVNELGLRLARNIDSSPHLGLKLVGFYDDRPASRGPGIPSELGHRLGNLDELMEQARLGRVERIYITFPMRAETRIKKVLERLADTTASVYVVPDFFVFELLHSRWTSIGGLPVVSVFENPFYGVDGAIKRLADICLATLFLAVAAVPMAVAAVLVKLSSPGPVFFRQQRYGLDGRQINVWKFRSMRVGKQGEAVVQATKVDPRVTRIGAILRKTSLDELPQLFNVLDGSMSLVGPRPHATSHNEMYRKIIQGYMLRHKVKPGITGLAQVNGWRGETDTLYKMEKRVEFDHQYIREWSPWVDIKILVKTIFTVLFHHNAY